MVLSDVAYFTTFALSAMLGAFGIRIDEEPAHIVVLKEGRFEIRRYAPHAAASVPMGDDEGTAFKRLAGYILGGNEGARRIAMTAPVVMPNDRSRLPMTAFVATSAGRSAEMTFSMPSRYTLDSLPKPRDPGIRLHLVPERTVASVSFRGSARVADRTRREAELRAWIAKKGWSAAPDAIFAGYDPPFTVPLLRRNEIHIQVHEAAR